MGPDSTPAPLYDLAKRLYQVYAQHASWKDYRNEPLPGFDEMRPATRAHWLYLAEDLARYGLGKAANDLRLVETGKPSAIQ